MSRAKNAQVAEEEEIISSAAKVSRARSHHENGQ